MGWSLFKGCEIQEKLDDHLAVVKVRNEEPIVCVQNGLGQPIEARLNSLTTAQLQLILDWRLRTEHTEEVLRKEAEDKYLKFHNRLREHFTKEKCEVLGCNIEEYDGHFDLSFSYELEGTSKLLSLQGNAELVVELCFDLATEEYFISVGENIRNGFEQIFCVNKASEKSIEQMLLEYHERLSQSTSYDFEQFERFWVGGQLGSGLNCGVNVLHYKDAFLNLADKCVMAFYELEGRDLDIKVRKGASELILSEPTIEGELLTEAQAGGKVSPQELEEIVKKVNEDEIESPNLRIFNDATFEVDSFIFMHKKQWLFYHSQKVRILSWDWGTDMDALIKGCHDEMDLCTLNEGWEINYEHFSEDFTGDFIEEQINKLDSKA